jgi:glutamate-1-semialdehyde 2,1-aminomutase
VASERPPAGAGPRSRRLNEIARGLFPGGVSSPVRAFRRVGGEPPVIRAARGAWLTDVDGNRYVDLLGAWGPMIVGHGHPAVLAAVRRRISRGTATGTPSPDEVRLGRRIRDAMPSLERLRFVCSGTEATMSAIRLARAATKRDGIVKFEGCYHGHADAFLSQAGSGALTFDTPESPGVPERVVAETHTVPYNDLAATQSVLEAQRGRIAAVVVEPVVGNMGFVAPVAGFLAGLRRLCDAHGALLVFDEVMTGFRVHLGGAQALHGVRPDLTCLGKVIGGGFPVAAYGGRADLLQRIAPEGPVYQAGTMSGNPVAMTAGLATLRALQAPGVFDALSDATSRLAEEIEAALRGGGVDAVVPHVGGMAGLWFAQTPPRDLTEAKATRLDRFAPFHASMLRSGVHLPPSPFEAWFVSTAHGSREIEHVVSAAEAWVRSQSNPSHLS